jgi:hypothetical protein
MASRFLTVFLFLFPAFLFAQKNVTDVTKSNLTGITLPAGSKQDKRILSAAAAETLLEMKAGEMGRSVSGDAEVLILPVSSNGGGSETVKQLLRAAGFNITEVRNDTKYTILEREAKSFLIYVDETKTATDLYTIILEEKPVVVQAEAVKPESVSTPLSATIPAAAATVSPAETPKTQSPPVAEEKIKPESEKPVAKVSASGYKFTTTNFNDGWVASITDDYVLVTKEKISVRLYYAAKITEQMRPPEGEIHDYFWNSLVIPSFNIIQAWKWDEPLTYFRKYYIWAEAVEKSTGNKCYIGLNVAVDNGIANPVLAIAGDRQSYDAQFPNPDDIKNMLGYNRFAVSLSDLPGTWTASGSSALQYYNVYTGASAGMAFTASNDEFTFLASGQYSSKHNGASGMVGNMQTYNQEYKGTATVNDWEIILTNRWKDKTDVFEAWFEAVKGGRILRLVDKNARGITYNLVKISR